MEAPVARTAMPMRGLLQFTLSVAEWSTAIL